MARGALPGDFFDLAVSGGDGWDDEPPADDVTRLASADLQQMLAEAVKATCAARQAALNWREGPPLAEWSLIEMRVALDGALWVTIHEYATDEYSLWMVAFDHEGRAGEVRRRPYVPVDGDPVAAGTIVG